MYGKIAADADNNGRYQEAVDNYLKAVEIFTYMIKCKYHYENNNSIFNLYG
jgi:MIT (microtubule interacting and transport) domain